MLNWGDEEYRHALRGSAMKRVKLPVLQRNAGIVAENQSYFGSAPWLVFLPGVAIILLALSFNLVGDALRDILDPTQKGRH